MADGVTTLTKIWFLGGKNNIPKSYHTDENCSTLYTNVSVAGQGFVRKRKENIFVREIDQSGLKLLKSIGMSSCKVCAIPEMAVVDVTVDHVTVIVNGKTVNLPRGGTHVRQA